MGPRALRIVCTVLALWAACAAFAAAEDDAGRPANVTLAGQTIVTLRGTVGGFPPEERAHRATLRLVDVLSTADGDAIGTRVDDAGVLLTLNDARIVLLAPDDRPGATPAELQAEALAAAERLRAAVGAYRLEQTPAARTRAIALAAGATVLLFAALLVLLRLHGSARRGIEALVQRRLHRVHGGFRATLAARAGAVARLAAGALLGLVAVVLFWYWLVFVLARFPGTRSLADTLGGFILRAAGELLWKAAASIPDILTVVLIVVVARLVARGWRALFDAIERGSLEIPWFHPETAPPTRRIAVLFTWVAAAVVAYPYLPGSQSLAFKSMSLFLGVMVSLGSSGLVNQVLSGLVLMYSRSYRPGDYVEVQGHEGTVLTLGLLSTKLRTPKQEEVTIPNAVMIGSATRNYSRLAEPDGVILHTTVTIGYGTPWRQVHAMLLLAAARTPGLRARPEPFVLQTSLSDFYVSYQLNARMVRPDSRPATFAALHANIQDVFNEYGVQIMSPHYLQDPLDPVVVPPAQWYAAPAVEPAAATAPRDAPSGP